MNLSALTTLQLGGPANRFVRVPDESALRDALADAARAGERVLIVGGGSNLVVSDAGWDGLVIQPAMVELDFLREGNVHRVDVGAGVGWDDFVARAVVEGAAGVECLAGIPGLVGATPMQNVGAYGQEVADTIDSVRAYDRETDEVVSLPAAACRFGYRTSMFKGSARWIVVGVRFDLPRSPMSAPIRYPELAKALGLEIGERAPLAEVRRTVIELRRGKGMVVDPADPDSRSAGSFFTNPIVEPGTLAELEMPRWPQPDGRVKLSAAWLIERAGFAKGTARGRVGTSAKHALALVTRDGATTAELLAYADEICAGVRARFGIALDREPVVV